MREVLVNVMHSDGWSVHFLEADARTRVGPWLILHAEHEVLDLLHRGNITAHELDDYHLSMRAWGRTTTHIHLDDDQYARLVVEGKRRPWNGYEERQRQQRLAARKPKLQPQP